MWPVWDALAQVRPDDPGETGLPGASEGALADIFQRAGVRHLKTAEVEVTRTHPSFEEWWEPYTHGVGPIGQALAALDPGERDQVEQSCRDRLGSGPFEITAVAFVAHGRA